MTRRIYYYILVVFSPALFSACQTSPASQSQNLVAAADESKLSPETLAWAREEVARRKDADAQIQAAKTSSENPSPEMLEWARQELARRKAREDERAAVVRRLEEQTKERAAEIDAAERKQRAEVEAAATKRLSEDRERQNRLNEREAARLSRQLSVSDVGRESERWGESDVTVGIQLGIVRVEVPTKQDLEREALRRYRIYLNAYPSPGEPRPISLISDSNRVAAQDAWVAGYVRGYAKAMTEAIRATVRGRMPAF